MRTAHDRIARFQQFVADYRGPAPEIISMRVTVIFRFMSLFNDPARQIRILPDVLAAQKERRMNAVLFEDVQNNGGRLRVRSVVECQMNAARPRPAEDRGKQTLYNRNRMLHGFIFRPLQ
jgi:hypothetical protein